MTSLFWSFRKAVSETTKSVFTFCHLYMQGHRLRQSSEVEAAPDKNEELSKANF